jgi:acyl carrier protein
LRFYKEQGVINSQLTPMPEQTIEEVLTRIVRKVTKRNEAVVSADTTFAELKADSLDRVQILISLEDTYDISLPEEEVAKVNTMGEFVDLVKSRIEAKRLSV